MHLAQVGFPVAGLAALQRKSDIAVHQADDGAHIMLSYFGIYSQYGADFLRNVGAQKPRFRLGLLPHEIAELNERSARQTPARSATPSPSGGAVNAA